MHPLVMPWAAARETPTADLYESTLRRKAKVLPIAPPRAKRRAVWAARRRKGNELRRDLNQTLPEGAPERLTRRQLSERWRASWQPLKTGA